jgi:hypothetical protein
MFIVQSAVLCLMGAALFVPFAVLADEKPAQDPVQDLVAHYRFDAGQGDKLRDESGHGHHGRIVGARWEKTADRWAMRFDGSGDYVDFLENQALKIDGDFTLLAWVTLAAPVYPDALTNWTLFDCEAYPADGTILRIDGAATTLMFRASRAGATPYQFGKARVANHGTYLLGVVHQGTRARLIVDGATDAEFTLGEPLSGSTSFKISSPSQSFAGLMHEAQLFRRALSAQDLARTYWQGAPRFGKDITQQGRLTLRGSAYVDDPMSEGRRSFTSS